MSDQPRPEVLRHTASVVAAHLGNNKVAPEHLPQLIQTVYQALSDLAIDLGANKALPNPAVPVRRSVFPDYIVCLEDGARLKLLKRYLGKHYGLTPAAYRERWGLPADYPMVAPNYARQRSTLAKQFGLGHKKEPAALEQGFKAAAVPEPQVADPQTESGVIITKVPARRARGVKK